MNNNLYYNNIINFDRLSYIGMIYLQNDTYERLLRSQIVN